MCERALLMTALTLETACSSSYINRSFTQSNVNFFTTQASSKTDELSRQEEMPYLEKTNGSCSDVITNKSLEDDSEKMNGSCSDVIADKSLEDDSEKMNGSCSDVIADKSLEEDIEKINGSCSDVITDKSLEDDSEKINGSCSDVITDKSLEDDSEKINGSCSDVITDKSLQTDYAEFIDQVDARSNADETAEQRYVSISKRKNFSVLDLETMKNLCHGKGLTYWKGINLMKDSLDLIIYQQLIWREKPRAIFEIGSYTGACAVWMADTVRSYAYDCHIYSMDINVQLVDERAKQDSNVTFVSGDSNNIETAFPPEFLRKIPHPWVVSEDAHVNVIGVMEYFDQFMLEGDYFIIEDTSPDSPLFSGQGLFEEKGYDGFGNRKLAFINKFLESRPNAYKVDSFYADFFGYNATFNWNGYIRKIK